MHNKFMYATTNENMDENHLQVPMEESVDSLARPPTTINIKYHDQKTNTPSSSDSREGGSSGSFREFRVCHKYCCSRELFMMIIVMFVLTLSFTVVIVFPESCNAGIAFGLILTIMGALLGIITKKHRLVEFVH